jgi:hypothetical protein
MRMSNKEFSAMNEWHSRTGGVKRQTNLFRGYLRPSVFRRTQMSDLVELDLKPSRHHRLLLKKRLNTGGLQQIFISKGGI